MFSFTDIRFLHIKVALIKEEADLFLSIPYRRMDTKREEKGQTSKPDCPVMVFPILYLE